MDGRGRCLDNVFIERLWRSLKYEAVYLHELADGFAAERVIAAWMTFYGDERPHSARGGRTLSMATEDCTLFGVRPCGWTASGHGFDRARCVLILELYGAQVA